MTCRRVADCSDIVGSIRRSVNVGSVRRFSANVTYVGDKIAARPPTAEIPFIVPSYRNPSGVDALRLCVADNSATTETVGARVLFPSVSKVMGVKSTDLASFDKWLTAERLARTSVISEGDARVIGGIKGDAKWPRLAQRLLAPELDCTVVVQRASRAVARDTEEQGAGDEPAEVEGKEEKVASTKPKGKRKRSAAAANAGRGQKRASTVELVVAEIGSWLQTRGTNDKADESKMFISRAVCPNPIIPVSPRQPLYERFRNRIVSLFPELLPLVIDPHKTRENFEAWRTAIDQPATSRRDAGSLFACQTVPTLPDMRTFLTIFASAALMWAAAFLKNGSTKKLEYHMTFLTKDLTPWLFYVWCAARGRCIQHGGRVASFPGSRFAERVLLLFTGMHGDIADSATWSRWRDSLKGVEPETAEPDFAATAIGERGWSVVTDDDAALVNAAETMTFDAWCVRTLVAYLARLLSAPTLSDRRIVQESHEIDALLEAGRDRAARALRGMTDDQKAAPLQSRVLIDRVMRMGRRVLMHLRHCHPRARFSRPPVEGLPPEHKCGCDFERCTLVLLETLNTFTLFMQTVHFEPALLIVVAAFLRCVLQDVTDAAAAAALPLLEDIRGQAAPPLPIARVREILHALLLSLTILCKHLNLSVMHLSIKPPAIPPLVAPDDTVAIVAQACRSLSSSSSSSSSSSLSASLITFASGTLWADWLVMGTSTHGFVEAKSHQVDLDWLMQTAYMRALGVPVDLLHPSPGLHSREAILDAMRSPDTKRKNWAEREKKRGQLSEEEKKAIDAENPRVIVDIAAKPSEFAIAISKFLDDCPSLPPVVLLGISEKVLKWVYIIRPRAPGADAPAITVVDMTKQPASLPAIPTSIAFADIRRRDPNDDTVLKRRLYLLTSPVANLVPVFPAVAEAGNASPVLYAPNENVRQMLADEKRRVLFVRAARAMASAVVGRFKKNFMRDVFEDCGLLPVPIVSTADGRIPTSVGAKKLGSATQGWATPRWALDGNSEALHHLPFQIADSDSAMVKLYALFQRAAAPLLEEKDASDEQKKAENDKMTRTMLAHTMFLTRGAIYPLRVLETLRAADSVVKAAQEGSLHSMSPAQALLRLLASRAWTRIRDAAQYRRWTSVWNDQAASKWTIDNFAVDSKRSQQVAATTKWYRPRPDALVFSVESRRGAIRDEVAININGKGFAYPDTQSFEQAAAGLFPVPLFSEERICRAALRWIQKFPADAKQTPALDDFKGAVEIVRGMQQLRPRRRVSSQTVDALARDHQQGTAPTSEQRQTWVRSADGKEFASMSASSSSSSSSSSSDAAMEEPDIIRRNLEAVKATVQENLQRLSSVPSDIPADILTVYAHWFTSGYWSRIPESAKAFAPQGVHLASAPPIPDVKAIGSAFVLANGQFVDTAVEARFKMLLEPYEDLIRVDDFKFDDDFKLLSALSAAELQPTSRDNALRLFAVQRAGYEKGHTSALADQRVDDVAKLLRLLEKHTGERPNPGRNALCGLDEPLECPDMQSKPSPPALFTHALMHAIADMFRETPVLPGSGGLLSEMKQLLLKVSPGETVATAVTAVARVLSTDPTEEVSKTEGEVAEVLVPLLTQCPWTSTFLSLVPDATLRFDLKPDRNEETKTSLRRALDAFSYVPKGKGAHHSRTTMDERATLAILCEFTKAQLPLCDIIRDRRDHNDQQTLRREVSGALAIRIGGGVSTTLFALLFGVTDPAPLLAYLGTQHANVVNILTDEKFVFDDLTRAQGCIAVAFFGWLSIETLQLHSCEQEFARFYRACVMLATAPPPSAAASSPPRNPTYNASQLSTAKLFTRFWEACVCSAAQGIWNRLEEQRKLFVDARAVAVFALCAECVRAGHAMDDTFGISGDSSVPTPIEVFLSFLCPDANPKAVRTEGLVLPRDALAAVEMKEAVETVLHPSRAVSPRRLYLVLTNALTAAKDRVAAAPLSSSSASTDSAKAIAAANALQERLDFALNLSSLYATCLSGSSHVHTYPANDVAAVFRARVQGREGVHKPLAVSAMEWSLSTHESELKRQDESATLPKTGQFTGDNRTPPLFIDNASSSSSSSSAARSLSWNRAITFPRARGTPADLIELFRLTLVRRVRVNAYAAILAMHEAGLADDKINTLAELAAVPFGSLLASAVPLSVSVAPLPATDLDALFSSSDALSPLPDPDDP